MEKQQHQQKHEHVMYVHHESTVDDEQIKTRVQSEHIDDQHDERQLVIVHHVQHDIMEMERQHRRHQHEHVVRVETDIIVDDEMIDIYVHEEHMEMELQQQEHSQQDVRIVETEHGVHDEQQEVHVQHEQ